MPCPCPVEPSIWLDIAKAFIGAFFGAGFAFGTTVFVQWRQRRRDEAKAGNLAIAVLREMLNAYLSVRKAMLAARALVQKVSPGAPLWLHFKPTTHPYPEKLSFDLSALSFLFDKHGVEAVQKLSLAETNYRSLGMLIAVHRESKEAIQARLGALGVPAGSMLPPDIESKLGFDLVEKSNDLTAILLKHFELDQPIYEDAYQFLKSELTRRYGDKFISIAEAGRMPMNQDEMKDRQRLYEKTRDEVNSATRSMSENLDKALLTLSSGFLGGSLAFVGQVVALEAAQFRWLLYSSWSFFVLTIAVTVITLVAAILHQRPLHEAAEKFYLRGDESGRDESAKYQQKVFAWNIICSASFVLGIVSLSAFVALNLSRGNTPMLKKSIPPATFQTPTAPAAPAAPQAPASQPAPKAPAAQSKSTSNKQK